MHVDTKATVTRRIVVTIPEDHSLNQGAERVILEAAYTSRFDFDKGQWTGPKGWTSWKATWKKRKKDGKLGVLQKGAEYSLPRGQRQSVELLLEAAKPNTIVVVTES